MTAVEDACTGAIAIATAALYAPLLLDSDEAAAARWRTLGDSELDAEIESYRAALRTLRSELNGSVAAYPSGAASGKACSQQQRLGAHVSHISLICGFKMAFALQHGVLTGPFSILHSRCS